MKSWQFPAPPFANYKNHVFTKAALVSDFIFQIGEYPGLRQPSEPVELSQIVSPVMKQKIKYLNDCLHFYRKITGHGRGISAVQAGIPERFAIIDMPEGFLTIINPVITKKSTKKLKYPEICMSASPIIVPTIRPAWIEFEYYDEDGQKQLWNAKDNSAQDKILNRVFQHEIDHMEGMINIDICKDPKEISLESDPDFYKNATFEEVNYF